MRDLSGSPLLLAAMANTTGIASSMSATFSKTRGYSDTVTTNPGASSNPVGMSGSPQRQDACIQNDVIYTAVVDSAGDIWLQVGATGSAKPVHAGITIACEPLARPSLFAHASQADQILLAYITTGSVFMFLTIDVDLIISSPSTCVIGHSTGPTLAYGIGAISSVSAYGAAPLYWVYSIFYKKDGGVGVDIVYYSNAWYTITWGKRFMYPNYIVTGYDTQVFSAAVLLGRNVYHYISNPETGEIQSMMYNLDSQSFSDIFTAVPSDISICRVANAVVSGSTVYMAIQYTRTGVFATSGSYNMCLKSVDGKNFSLDRAAIFSSTCYRFSVHKSSSNTAYFTDCNKSMTFGPYFFGDPDPTDITISGSSNIITATVGARGFTMMLSDANEAYFDNATITLESRVKIYMGYRTSSGSQAILVGTYRISGISREMRDARRGINISGESESNYLVQNMAYPMLTELIGKSSCYDDLSLASGNMYVAPEILAQRSGSISIDMWESTGYSGSGATAISIVEGGGATYYSSASSGSHLYGVKSQDVMMQLGLDGYPLWDGTSDIHVKIYGWDYDNISGSAGDIVTPVLCLSGSLGETEIFPHKTDLVSTYSYLLPYTGGTGSYPVEWLFDAADMAEEDRLTNVAIVLQTNGVTTGSTTFYIERIEITGFVMKISPTDANTGWTVVEPIRKEFTWAPGGAGYIELSVGGAETQALGSELPGNARPYIMLAQRPYKCWNFDVEANFEADGGRVGLVGLAKDGANWIGGFYDQSVSGSWVISKCRDGIETILTSLYEAPSGSTLRLKFSHRDGVFSIYRGSVSGSVVTWLTASLSYTWTEADGVLDGSGSNVFHVGIYGDERPYYFETPSFNIGDGEGILVAPTSLLSSGYTKFPASGSVKIDDSVYAYTGKTIGGAGKEGPFQSRCVHGTETIDVGGGVEITVAAYSEITWFDWMGVTDAHVDKLFGSSNGHTWYLRDSLSFGGPGGCTNWQVSHTDDGDVVWDLNRSRWYFFSTGVANSLGLGERVYIGPGLTGITRVSGSGNHGLRARVSVYGGYTIRCTMFNASSGDRDTDIADLCEYIIRTSGGDVTFPNDTSYDTITVPRDTATILDTSGSVHKSLDSSIDVGVLAAGYWVGLKTNLYPNGDSGSPLVICLYRSIAGTELYVDAHYGYNTTLTTWPYLERVQLPSTFSPTTSHRFRVFEYNHFVSVYVDGAWAHTFAFPNMTFPAYPEEIKATWVSNYAVSTTGTNALFRELYSWREAIYMEMEASGNSALSSVIQERPVEMFCADDGKLMLTYNQSRATNVITGSSGSPFIRSHVETERDVPQAGSDALLEYTYLKGIRYPDYATNVGFASRAMNLPNLDDTEVEWMAYILLEMAYQRRKMHSFMVRPDLRLEEGDELYYKYQRSSTGTVVSGSCIIEDLTTELADGVYSQKISARSKT